MIDFLKENNVDVDYALNNMGDIELYNEILDDFYNSLDDEYSKIVNYKNLNDMDNYRILVHAMKSNAKSLGFKELADVSYNHEMASKNNDIKYVNDHFNEFKDYFNKTKNIILEYKNNK